MNGRRHYILWFLVAVALYLAVTGDGTRVIPSAQPVDNPVFPQVCRVVMPEDVER